MEELQKLYDVLVREGKYSKSFDDFKSKWSKDSAYKDKVYGVVTRDGLYSKDKDSFFQKYSTAEPVVKKKDIGVSKNQIPQQDATELPSEDGSLATQPTKLKLPDFAKKEPVKEEEDYFTGTFGNVLRGFDNIVPLGIGDFVDDMARSVASGYRQGNVAQAANELLLKGHKSSPEQIKKFIEANKSAQQLKPSAEMEDYTKTYEKEGKGFWGVVKGLANNPSIIPEVLTSSLVSMATNTDALTAGGAAIGAGAGIGATTGAATGATVGSVVPVAGTAVGGVGGALAGAVSGAASAVPYAFGLASTVVETGATFGELLTEELKGKDLTKENVKSILENPEKLQSIRNKAIARGIVIGTLDALTGKLASGVGAKILSKSAAKSAVGTATKTAVVKSTAAGAGIEAAGGSIGEAAARAVTGQEMDVSEIALEGLAELPGGVRSTIQARLAKPSYRVNGEKVSAEQVDDLINTMTPEELVATDIVIKNDYEGRMFKIQDKVVTNSIKNQVREANPELNEPSLNAITELEKQLTALEGNKTQTGRDKSASIRAKIKDIQENQLTEAVTSEVASEVEGSFELPEEKIAKLEAELETITDDNNPRIAEIDAEINDLETLKAEKVDSEIEASDRFYKKQLKYGVEWEQENAKEYFKDKRKYIQGNLDLAKERLKKDPTDGFSKRSVENHERFLKELETIKTKEDAVQEQSTTEIPVQSEVGVSETMEEGKPESEPEVITEQGIQEEEVVEPNIAKSLQDVSDEKYNEFLNKNINLFNEKLGSNADILTEDVAKIYFDTKKDGTNPEFVKAVEDLLSPKAEATPSETIITEQTVTPETKPTEVKTEAVPTEKPTEEKFIIDGKEYNKEQAIEKSQNNSRLPVYGSKMEYSGNDPEAKRFVKEYNRDSNPYNDNGELKGSYIQKQILKALNEMNFRKFGNLYRKHIDPFFSRANNEKSIGGILDKNYSFRELAGYIIGDSASSDFKEADFRAFAKEAGINIPEFDIEQTPVSKEVVPTEVSVKPKTTPKQKALQIDIAIQALFDRNGKDTSKWVNQSDNRDLIALRRAKKAVESDAKTLKTFLNTSMGQRYLEMEAKFEKPKVEPKAEPTPKVETPKVETPKAETKKPSNLDKKIEEAENDADFYYSKAEDIQEEIKNETQNTKEEVADINKKIAEVKADKSLSRAEKKEAVEDLKAEIDSFKDNQEAVISDLKDDLKEAKSDYKKSLKKLDKIKQQKVSTKVTIEEEVKGKVDELLELDANEKSTLAKISSELGDMIEDIKRIEKEMGSNILLVPMKYILQTIKALVDAGMTLQEAIKKVAADESLKVNDIIKGINSVSEIAKIAPAYNELMEKADKLIARQKAKGIDKKKIVSKLDTMVRKSDVYLAANDAQKKIMEREARARMGVAPRKAPSIGRVLGVINDIKNVSREEKLKIISRIRELSRDAAKDLIEEIRGLSAGGKITATQATNIIAKFSKVNMLNEISVSNFVDYMAKVFADAEYGNKISVAKSKLKAAKKNINTKIGIANGLAFPLQTLFSINPKLIPINNLERYLELLAMFSDRKAVLQLDEISKVTNDVNEILDAINNEQSLVPELAYRLNNSKNQVLKDGELDYAATIKKMISEGEITQDEADLMVKYKNEINPQDGKAKKTEEELEKEKKELEVELKKSTVNVSNLPTRDERSVAKRIAEHLKKPFINQLSNTELKNLIKGIDNINNGYLPHQALLILEKLDNFYDGKIEANVIENGSLSTARKIYNSVKGKLTGRDAAFEMIRRAPLFNIDQVLGNFKTQELFNALLGRSARGEAKFSFELKTIEEKLKKAQDKVAKSFGLNPLKSKISNYKIKTYLIQLEHDTNPGDNRVNPAAKYIEATIKHINKLKSQYNENDVKILEDILNDFSTDGNIDIKKLYDSFNSAEKNAIKVLQEIKKSESEKAEFTGAVIRGKRINPLNNHTHISVLSEDSKSDLDSGASFAESYNNSLMPSTKAKSLMERTPGVKPINFDAYSTAHKSAKYVLLDYYLTSPIRTARKSIKTAEAELDKDGGMSKEKRRIFNAVNDSFELAVKDLVMNSYVQSSFGADMVNYISKQGYRAVLAGLGRSGVELLSNLGFVAFDPFTFYKGVEYTSILLSEDGPAIMNNVGSVQTNRVYASGLSGRMIDVGILNQSIGTKSSKTQGKVINKALQMWNKSGKRGLNAVELTADALITSPDKLVMRPYWMGSFAVEFKKQTGSEPDFEKIAENNEEYMNDNQEVIESAREVADRKSALMGATKNGFTGLLRGKTRAEDNAGAAIVKNFNSFMTNFMIYEYTAAKTGVMAAIGRGTMTRAEGAAVLGGVVTRMTVYNLLINAATVGVSGLLGLAFGDEDEDEDEEEEKTVNQMLGQSLTSTFATLMFGRDFGNASKTVINLAFEEFVTKEYLQGLRTGEYDPYKDTVLRTSLTPDEKTGEIKFYENIPNFMGSYGPVTKTVALGFKALTTPDKKEAKAIERQEKERYVRLPLEILGNAGFVPLYKEVRKSVMDDIYKDLKNKNGSGITKEELKKSDPDMYKIMYGEN